MAARAAIRDVGRGLEIPYNEVDRIAKLVRSEDEDELARVQKLLWGATAGLVVIALLMVSGIFTTVWTTSVYSDISERQLQILSTHVPNIVRGTGIE